MIGEVRDRLLQGHFTAVEVCEDLQSIVGQAPAAANGTVFVAPWREKARPPIDATGRHSQLVECQFVTAILVRQHGDPRGAERAARWDMLKAEVQRLIAGWLPPSATAVCALSGAEASRLGNGVSIYAITWQTAYFLTGAPS